MMFSSDAEKLVIGDFILNYWSKDKVEHIRSEITRSNLIHWSRLKGTDYNVILQIICGVIDADINLVKSPSRKGSQVTVRQIFSYIITKIESPEYFKTGILNDKCREIIGKYLNRTKHNVNNLLKKVNNYMETDKTYADQLIYIERVIYNEMNYLDEKR